EESRFLINPYLLMGVRECNALITSYTPDGSDSLYPQATELSWNADESLAMAKFQMSGYRVHLDKIDARGDRHALCWADYNARDFALNYFYVDPANSTNLNLELLWETSLRFANSCIVAAAAVIPVAATA